MSIISSNSADIKSKYIPALMRDELVRGKGKYAVKIQKGSSFMSDLCEAANITGLKIVRLDCAKIVNLYDAIGWLSALSNQSPEEKPSILVIENSTELSTRELQYALVHAWKNDETQFTDDRPGQNGDVFVVRNREYLVYLTWDAEKENELNKIWHPGDGIVRIDNYGVWKKELETMYQNMSNEDFAKCLKLRGMIKN